VVPDSLPGTAAAAAVLRPDSYFETHAPGLSLVRALAVVALSASVVAAVVWAVGGALAEAVAHVSVPNPDRPPDWACEDGALETAGCSAPERVPASRVLRDVLGRFVVFAFLGIPGVWVASGLLVYAGAHLAGGDGSLRDTFAVTAWGLVPTTVTAVASGGVLVWLLSTRGLSAGTLEAVVPELQALLAGPTALALAAVGLVGVAWQAVVHYYGVREAHRLSPGGAATVAGLYALVSALFTLA
jgi:hypothetical protein